MGLGRDRDWTGVGLGWVWDRDWEGTGKGLRWDWHGIRMKPEWDPMGWYGTGTRLVSKYQKGLRPWVSEDPQYKMYKIDHREKMGTGLNQRSRPPSQG